VYSEDFTIFCSLYHVGSVIWYQDTLPMFRYYLSCILFHKVDRQAGKWRRFGFTSLATLISWSLKMTSSFPNAGRARYVGNQMCIFALGRDSVSMKSKFENFLLVRDVPADVFSKTETETDFSFLRKPKPRN